MSVRTHLKGDQNIGLVSIYVYVCPFTWFQVMPLLYTIVYINSFTLTYMYIYPIYHHSIPHIYHIGLLEFHNVTALHNTYPIQLHNIPHTSFNFKWCHIVNLNNLPNTYFHKHNAGISSCEGEILNCQIKWPYCRLPHKEWVLNIDLRAELNIKIS